MKKFFFLTEQKLNKLIEEKRMREQSELNQELEQELLKRHMDITMLQGQINPHFLYNALECIRGQALIYDVPEIADTTEALSKFFRYSINTKSNIVTLREELENVNNYVKIQQYRFHNRFQIEVLYDEQEQEVFDVLIPKLTLQPIIENAIVHGFERTRKNAFIKIEIIKTIRHINLLISDNGIGMNRKQLETICNNLLKKQDVENLKNNEKSNGIALYNINRRIQLFYGEEYGLTVSSLEGIGTDVEIHIPFLLVQ